MYSPPTVSSTSSHLPPPPTPPPLLYMSAFDMHEKKHSFEKTKSLDAGLFLVFLLLSVSFSPLSFHIPSLNGMTQKQASTLCLLIVEGFVLERKCEKKKASCTEWTWSCVDLPCGSWSSAIYCILLPMINIAALGAILTCISRTHPTLLTVLWWCEHTH